MASEVARRLRGKHRAIFTPYADTGDFMVVINADKVVLTGRKLDQKKYYHYSGYIGGLKEKTAQKQMASKPRRPFARRLRVCCPKTVSVGGSSRS